MEELHTDSLKKNVDGTPIGDKRFWARQDLLTISKPKNCEVTLNYLRGGNHSCARREKMKWTTNSIEIPKTKLICQQ